MVSIHTPIFYSFSPHFKPLETVPSVPIQLVLPSSPRSTTFSVLWQSLSIFSLSLFFPLWSAWTAKSSTRYVLFGLFVNYHLVWSSGRDQVIRFYLKISDNHMHLILLDEFWFLPISFGSMVKFRFLAQFPADHLSNPSVSSLKLLLRYFAAFAYLLLFSLESYFLYQL